MTRKPPRSPLRRTAELIAGVLLVIAAAILGPLPGPGGTILFAGGLVLLLRNSKRTRRLFCRIKRRYPRIEALLDRALQRKSAARRRERDKRAAAAEPARPDDRRTRTAH